MKWRPRLTASAVISSRIVRSAASSHSGSPRSQKPCSAFAFLNVESGCSWRPSPGKYWKRTWLPRKLTWAPVAG